MHNLQRMVWQNDLPIQKHKPSISLLKGLIEVSGIFVIGNFSINILFHETATVWEKLRFKKFVVSFGI
jgi:hypothetical protein